MFVAQKHITEISTCCSLVGQCNTRPLRFYSPGFILIYLNICIPQISYIYMGISIMHEVAVFYSGLVPIDNSIKVPTPQL